MSVLVTCMASSCVGISMRPWGLCGPAAAPSRCAINGRPNASVLLALVAARPSRSWSARTLGIVAAWIGNGDAMPLRESALIRPCGRPSVWNPGRSLVGTIWMGRLFYTERDEERVADPRMGEWDKSIFLGWWCVLVKFDFRWFWYEFDVTNVLNEAVYVDNWCLLVWISLLVVVGVFDYVFFGVIKV